MPTRGVTFERARELALALPGVVESTSYGTPALKLGKKMIARLKEDGETLVLKMDIVSRDLLLRAKPQVYYLTDHYRDYPYVLVRLAKVGEKELVGLFEDACRLAAPRRQSRK
jgi:hypothetical protein